VVEVGLLVLEATFTEAIEAVRVGRRHLDQPGEAGAVEGRRVRAGEMIREIRCRKAQTVLSQLQGIELREAGKRGIVAEW
jgi:hypothetical protein